MEEANTKDSSTAKRMGMSSRGPLPSGLKIPNTEGEQKDNNKGKLQKVGQNS